MAAGASEPPGTRRVISARYSNTHFAMVVELIDLSRQHDDNQNSIPELLLSVSLAGDASS